MKKYSLRIEMEIEAPSDNEAIHKTDALVKELPKMDGARLKNGSLFNKGTKKVIKEV